MLKLTNFSRAGLVLAAAASAVLTIADDKLIPPPYVVTGLETITTGVTWDEAAIRSALRDAANHLTIDNQWVDQRARVAHDGIVQDLHLQGVSIHFDHHHMQPGSERRSRRQGTGPAKAPRYFPWTGEDEGSP